MDASSAAASTDAERAHRDRTEVEAAVDDPAQRLVAAADARDVEDRQEVVAVGSGERRVRMSFVSDERRAVARLERRPDVRIEALPPIVRARHVRVEALEVVDDIARRHDEDATLAQRSELRAEIEVLVG